MRPDVEDGKTEWFLIGVRELVFSVWKIRRAMQILFDDVELSYMPEVAKPAGANGSTKKSKAAKKKEEESRISILWRKNFPNAAIKSEEGVDGSGGTLVPDQMNDDPGKLKKSSFF